jgi:DNA polymerase
MSFVGQSGSPNAKIALIGEAPGRQELLDGVPFVGAPGRLVDAALKRANIHEVYKTNLIKQFAPTNPLINMAPEDLNFWRDLLRAELESVTANVLVPMGNTALWALVDDTVRIGYKNNKRVIENGISNWRGSTLRAFNGKKVIPSYHPTYILSDPTEKDTFLHDIQKIAIESLSPEIVLPHNTYYTRPKLDEALAYLQECRSAKRYAFDIETAQGICTCIGFSYDPSHAMCIPLQGHNYWSADEYMEIFNALNETLCDANATKIGQNVSYDIIGLQAMGVHVKPPIEDILLIHHSIDPLAQHSLAFQASMFTAHPFWKEWDIAPTASGNVRTLYEYNCKDSFVTLELSDRYHRHYPKRIQYYENFYQPLQPILIQMYFDGICQDFSLKTTLAEKFRAYGNDLSQTIADGLGVKNFNLNSPQAVMSVLYETLRLPVQKKRQYKGPSKPSVDDDALVNLYLQTQNPFVLLIRDAKEQLKLASFLDPKGKSAKSKRRSWDDRLRCEYSQNTKTGRLRAFASSTTGIGINLQQIPEIIRQVYIPAPGHIFLEPDFQQAEARAIAWDGIDLDTMDFFENARREPDKYDIHWRNATIMMQQSQESLTKADRQTAKPIGFGSWYGMTPSGIQRNILKMTDPPLFVQAAECARRQQLFKLNAPNCFQRQDRVREEVFTTGQQISPTGQLWTYHEVVIDDLKYCFGRREYNELYREIYSAIPQNVVAYLTARSIVRLHHYLVANRLGRVVLQVHDSILLEIKDNEASILDAFTNAKRIMEEPFTIRNNPMIIPADFKLGFRWSGDVKGIRNEDQLIEAYRKLKS